MYNEGQRLTSQRNIAHSHLLTSISTRKQESFQRFLDSNLQGSQQLDLNQNQKIIIPQIRSKKQPIFSESNKYLPSYPIITLGQQQSPIGFPQSRAFSQSCKRYKVKVNTNNSAIPKDFFYDIGAHSETYSLQLQGKENNQKYSNDSQQALMSFTNQPIDGKKQGTPNQLIKNYERVAQSSMAKYSMNDQNTPYRFLKQRNNFKKAGNNFNTENFIHQGLDIQLPNKSHAEKDIQMNEVNSANYNSQNPTNLLESNIYPDSGTPKFVEKRSLSNNNQLFTDSKSTRQSNQRNLFENQGLQKDFIKKQLIKQDLILQNASSNEQNQPKALSPQESLVKKNNNSQFQFQGMRELVNNNDTTTQSIIQSVQQKLKNFNVENTLTKIKYSKENDLIQNKKNLLLNNSSNNTPILDNLSQAQSHYNNEFEIENNINKINQQTQGDLADSQFYKIVRKKVGNNIIESQYHDTTPIKSSQQQANNQEIKTQTMKDSNKIANMITLTNEFIFNKDTDTSNKQQSSEVQTNQASSSADNPQNIQELNKYQSENVMNNKRFRYISNPSLNNNFQNKTNQLQSQQQNHLNHVNSCQKLSINSTWKPQLNQQTSHLQIAESDSQQSDSTHINKILENRSTTTSHLTKRQQLLYLQGTLKKRNQLSLHEDIHSSKNQSLSKNQLQLFNYFTENVNQQQSQIPNKLKHEHMPDYSNQMNLSFEKAYDQTIFQTKSIKKEIDNQSQQQVLGQSDVLPRIYPIKVKKESKERGIGLTYLQKQNMGSYQQQINSPTYGIITNSSQIMTTNNSLLNQHQNTTPDLLQYQQYQQYPFMIGSGHQIYNNITQRDKSRTANSSPLSTKVDLYSSRRDKYFQQQMQNDQPKNLIKIEQDLQDI